MAGVDVGGGDRRGVSADLNMVPFIDLLMVTIAFLLITAVWVSHARIETNAEVPGDRTGPVETSSRALHVYAEDERFVLRWRDEGTAIAETVVPRAAAGEGGYSALELAVMAAWQEHGVHRDVHDRGVDRCVLHTPDGMPFAQVVAVLDAIYDARRTLRVQPGAPPEEVAAFHVSFAVH